jgi:hypothetical protein
MKKNGVYLALALLALGAFLVQTLLGILAVCILICFICILGF